MTKLQELCEALGYDDETQLAADYVCDSICPAICMNENFDYTTEYEPDQGHGWCECCETNTVKSAFLLMGII